LPYDFADGGAWSPDTSGKVQLDSWLHITFHRFLEIKQFPRLFGHAHNYTLV